MKSLPQRSARRMVWRLACPLAVLLVSCTQAAARTWRITPDGTGDAPTVQAGLDSAHSADVVLLAAGTYTWTTQNASGTAMVHLVPGVTLRGEAGAAATILDAEARGRVAECFDAGAHVVVEDLTFVNGVAPPERPAAAAVPGPLPAARERSADAAGLAAPADCHGGALDVRGASQPLVRRCVFTGNVASGGTARGGAISCAVATLEDCEFTDNHAGVTGGTNGSGGAVSCTSAIIRRCTFRRNQAWGYEAAHGGAVRSVSADIADCIFADNRAECPGGPTGGAIYDPGRPSIVRCEFRANAVAAHYFYATGGALHVGVASVNQCLFLNNSATCHLGPGQGGGIAGRELAVAQCTFVGNVASSVDPVGAGSGGAIYALFASTIEHCTLVANSGGTADGVGGIWLDEEGTLQSLLVADTAVGRLGTGLGRWSCCLFFGNAAGDRPPGFDAGDNFSANPLFCADPRLAGDVAVRTDSPCAAVNRPWSPNCGLIGSGAVVCEGQAIEATSWSAVKLLYGGGAPAVVPAADPRTVAPGKQR